MCKEVPGYLQPLRLPDVRVLSVMGGTVEKHNNEYYAVEGGALWGVPDHRKKNIWGVINHSLLVRRVAITIATKLNEKHNADIDWIPLDTELVGNAALLEDFAKRYEKQQPAGITDHVQEAIRIFNNVDLPQKEVISKILRIHLYGMNNYNDEPTNWTEKVLVLADHYCTHRIVSIDQRNKDFEKRHAESKTMPTSQIEHERVKESRSRYQNELLVELEIDEKTFVKHLKKLEPDYVEKKLRKIFQRAYKKVPMTIEAVKRLENWQVLEAEKRLKRTTAIFDFGYVLMDYTPDDQWLQQLAEKAGLSTAEIIGFMKTTEADRLTGNMTDSQACQELQSQYPHANEINPDSFFEIEMILRPEMIAFVNALIEKGIKVAILTNTIPTHLREIKRILYEACPQLPRENIFASCEIGYRKTGTSVSFDEDVFQVVLSRLGISAENAIFIDDNQKYTHQARENDLVALDMLPGDKYIKDLIVHKLGLF